MEVPENEWTRFDFYAQRVLRITPNNQNVAEITESSFFCNIAAIRPAVVSFPRLCELRLPGRSITPIIVTSALIPPSLRELAIGFSPHLFNVTENGFDHPAGVILQDAPRFAPSIDTLAIQGSLPSACLIRVSQFPALRCLDLSGIAGVIDLVGTLSVYGELFRALSSSIHLLDLRLPRPLQFNDIPRDCVGFSRLETLHTGNSPHTVANFISMVSSANLRKLVIARSYPETQAPSRVWGLCLKIIRKRFGSSLRHLSLHINALESNISLVEFLQPILELPEMDTVAFTLSLYATNDDLRAMAEAWPKLTALEINPRANMDPGSSDCTISCLEFLTELCPGLVTLTIPIHDLVIPDLTTLKISPRNDLKNLKLTAYFLDDHFSLARILDVAYPMLRNVVVHKQRTPPLSIGERHISLQDWEDVPRLIKIFQWSRVRASVRTQIPS